MLSEHLASTAAVEMALQTAASHSEFALARAYRNCLRTYARQGRPNAIMSRTDIPPDDPLDTIYILAPERLAASGKANEPITTELGANTHLLQHACKRKYDAYGLVSQRERL